MKPLVKEMRKQLPPLKLYLKDLEYIVELLTSISPTKLEILTDEHEFTNLSDLTNTGETVLHDLQIRSFGPYISLRLTPGSASLYLAEDHPANVGIFEKINSLALKRRTYLLRVLRWSSLLLQQLLCLSIVISTCSQKSTAKPWTSQSVLSAFYILFIVFVPYLGFLIFGSLLKRFYSTIILKNRADAPSFWKRHWEGIVVGLIIGVVSTILGGWALNWSSSLLFKPSTTPPATIPAPSPTSSISPAAPSPAPK